MALQPNWFLLAQLLLMRRFLSLHHHWAAFNLTWGWRFELWSALSAQWHLDGSLAIFKYESAYVRSTHSTVRIWWSAL